MGSTFRHSLHRVNIDLLLTARVTESDKVLELEFGADEHITKPFGVRELIDRCWLSLQATRFGVA